MNGWDMSGWGWVWMHASLLLGIIAAMLVAALLIRATEAVGHRFGSGRADAILDQRLARGEINEDEYRRLRDLIAHHGA